jgi:hypothetical protein
MLAWLLESLAVLGDPALYDHPAETRRGVAIRGAIPFAFSNDREREFTSAVFLCNDDRDLFTCDGDSSTFRSRVRSL